MNLSSRDKQAVWHPYTQAGIESVPIPLKAAKGALLIGENGEEYIDAVSSWWVNLHGHGNPFITKAIKNTLDVIDQVIFAGFTHEPAVKLAENLLSVTHRGNGKVFFSDDGSTAVEAALKMSMQYWENVSLPRKTFIAIEGAYHGDTFGSMSVSGRGFFNKPFSDCLFDVKFISFPSKDGERSIKQLKEFIKNEPPAAFIFEPLIQGASGMRFFPSVALDAMIEICKEEGVITIADEVFTGFYRTGRLFASDYLLNKPDIYCLSKGITGGALPLGATVASNDIYSAFLANDRLKMFLHGHSYTANPLSCAAANASFELLMSSEVKSDINRINSKHLEFLNILSGQPNARNFRVLGTILAFEAGPDGESGYLGSLRDKLYNYYINSGVLLRPLGNTVYIVPPYCISNEELEKVYAVILKSLDEIEFQ